MARGEQLVLGKLERVRRQIKLVDVASGLLQLAIYVLAVWLVWVIIDHWLIDLGTFGRWVGAALFWGGLLLLATPSLQRLPRRVSQLHAALAVEEFDPTIKNRLVNYLFLSRVTETAVRPVVIRRLEQEAVHEVRAIHPLHAVDHGPLIRAGYLFAILLVFTTGYALFAPRSYRDSVRRFMVPWSHVTRPTRIRVERVKPGDVTVRFGENVTISADVHGASETEVTLRYRPLDGQFAEQAIPMKRPDNQWRFAAELPGHSAGVRQDIVYQIFAGDGQSREFRIDLEPASSMRVASVDYHYPAYTGLAPRLQVREQPDLVALDGTRITLHLDASDEIANGYVAFDPDVADSDGDRLQAGRHIPIRVGSDPRSADVTFLARFEPDGGAARSYWARYLTKDNVINSNPILHRIEVVADQIPEVELVEPAASEIEVPADGTVLVRLRARDVDFRLTRVALELESQGNVATHVLLDDSYAGRWSQSTELRGAELGWQSGQVWNLKGVAWDNHHDVVRQDFDPQRAESGVCRIHVTEPTRSPDRSHEENADSATPSGDDPKRSDRKERGDEGVQGDDGGGPSSQDGGQPEGGGGPSGTEGDGGSGAGQDGMGGAGGQEGGSVDDGESGVSGGQSGDGAAGDSGAREGGGPMGGSGGQGGSTAGEPSTGENSGSETGNRGRSGRDGISQEGSNQEGGDPSAGVDATASDQENRPEGGGESAGNSSDATASSRRSADGTGEAGRRGEGGGADERTDRSASGTRARRPVAKDGADDSEVFRRVRDYLNEHDSAKSEGAPADESGDDRQGERRGAPPTNQDDSPNGSTGGTGRETPTDGKRGDQGERGSDGRAADSGRLPPDGSATNAEPQPRGGNQGEADASRQTGRSREGQEGERGDTSNQSEWGDADGAARSDSPKSENGGNNIAGNNARRNDASASTNAGNANAGNNGVAEGTSEGERPEPAQGDTESSRGEGARPQPDEGGGTAPGGADGKTSTQANSTAPAPTDARSGSQGERAHSGERGTQATGAGEDARARNEPGPSDATAGDLAPHDDAGSQSNGQGGGTEHEGTAGRSLPTKPTAASSSLEDEIDVVDLVLETLRDQQHQPDSELLKELGWGEEDMTRFLERWDTLRAAAERTGEEERSESFRQAVESLGLGTPPAVRRQQMEQFRIDRLRNRGRRTAPPPRYRDLYRDFLQGNK